LEIAHIVGFDRAYTWNPAVGCHGIGCEVHRHGTCWAERYAKRFKVDFKPHLIPERLDEPLRCRRPSVITPVSMGDLFGQRREDTERVLDVFWEAGWHVYAILTKLPQHALDYYYLDNVWFGVTVNIQADVWRLDVLKDISAPKKYVLFEPLYGPIDYDLSWLDLIVIGPQTKPMLQPKKGWIRSIRDNAPGVRVFMKTTLRPVDYSEEMEG